MSDKKLYTREEFEELRNNSAKQIIVELGVAWGGSLLFYSTLMEVPGGNEPSGLIPI